MLKWEFVKHTNFVLLQTKSCLPVRLPKAGFSALASEASCYLLLDLPAEAGTFSTAPSPIFLS